jgi:PilZ domain-containing protein
MKPALEKRAAPRTKMVLPLKSSAAGPNNLSIAVHTLDLSRQGAKLGAFRDELKIGDILTVQRQHKRAQCKVVWVREIGPREIQVGIELLRNDEGFWGISLEDERVGVCTFSSERW